MRPRLLAIFAPPLAKSGGWRPSTEKLTQRPGSIGNSGLANGKARSAPTAPAPPFCGHIYGDVLVARSINGLDGPPGLS